MSLFSIKKMMNHASANVYAIPAFVCVNIEMIQAAIEAAEEESSPVIIQAHPEIRCKTSLLAFAEVVKSYASHSWVPIGLSLDHGESFEDVVDAVSAGFNGVMIDGADFSLQENIEITTRVVEMLSGKDIIVEGAIGNMPHGRQQTEQDIASVKDSLELVSKSGLGILAPAVGNVHGTAHGEDKATPHLNIERISDLKEACKIPLCLHGGSSIPEEQVKNAVKAGICKVIIFTDVVKSFNKALLDSFTTMGEGSNPLYPLKAAQEEARNTMMKKMKLFGSSSKALSILNQQSV